ncbi:MAG: alpha-1,2-fucosyltransferase [Opitutaceae bacterium]
MITTVIWMEMDGRLGNEMFQYASGKAIAARQRLTFVYSRHRHALERAFDLPGGVLGNAVLRGLSLPLRRGSVFKTRSPRMEMMVPGYEFETFDSSLFSCGGWTRIAGYLETPEYFAGREEEVRRWFRFRRRHRDRASEIERSFEAPAERRCCVHVRRTDLLGMQYPISHPETGFALPLEYYIAALARVPEDVAFVVIGDDMDFMRTLLAGRPRAYYSKGEEPAVDMALMGRCRWNVISNSTFAWWAAWLNPRDDRRVIGPKYFRGWNVRKWEMPGLAVDGWSWIDWR